MKQVGIMGGTFDPPTIAHLFIARQAKEELELDEIWFLPNYMNPLKQDKNISSASVRREMVELAIENESDFKLEPIELESKETCYTVETLEKLTEIYPDNHFTFLIGTDALNSLENWRSPERILDLANVVIFIRPGHKLQDSAQQWLDRVTMLPVLKFALSSTIIRDRRSKGKSIKYLVPDPVETYINTNKLYL